LSSGSRGIPPVIAARLGACRKRIQEKSVKGYLVTHPADGFYLTGFDGADGAILILSGHVYLLTDGRFAERAAKTAPWARAIIRRQGLPEVLAGLVKRHRIGRLGFQPESLSMAMHGKLRRLVRPGRLVSMPPVARELRQIKDGAEVSAIEKAIRVAGSAFRALRKRIRLRMTERQLAAILQHEMLDRGASAASFPVIVAEGPNSSLPHARPGDRKLRPGSVVLIDWGAQVGHYCSDLTRVIFVRRIPPRFKRMYEAVLAAQKSAIEAIRPGVRMCEVDARAREVLKRARLDHLFTHGLGHGLGLEVHEGPRLAVGVKEPLQAGMVVTVEPGVYRAGFGGIRIEDDVLVTETGCRVLSTVDKQLDGMVV